VIFAHVGHWAVDAAVYLGPVIVIALLFKVRDWQDRRRGIVRDDDPGDMSL